MFPISANLFYRPSNLLLFCFQIHSKGLKFGTYLDYGTHTCAGYPGTLGHINQDAQSLAEWEVDFIKLDGCNVDISEMVEGYIEFGRQMNKTGRPIM